MSKINNKYLVCERSRSIPFSCPFGLPSPCYVGNNGRRCIHYSLSEIVLHSDDGTYDVILICSHPSQVSLFFD